LNQSDQRGASVRVSHFIRASPQSWRQYCGRDLSILEVVASLCQSSDLVPLLVAIRKGLLWLTALETWESQCGLPHRATNLRGPFTHLVYHQLWSFWRSGHNKEHLKDNYSSLSVITAV